MFERSKLVHSSEVRGKAPSVGKINIKTILFHFEPIFTIVLTFHHNFNPYTHYYTVVNLDS